MTRTHFLRIAGLAVAASATLLAGCGGGGDDNGSAGAGQGAGGTGTLRVSLTDAPACGYDAVNVTVSRVRVHMADAADPNQSGWSEVVLNPPRRIDLLALQNGVLSELGTTQLPAGTYRQVRLVLADNATVPNANAVTPTGSAPVPLDTPSALTSGLKLQTNFTVEPNQTADIVLDFDACRSVVRRGNSGRYNLKPVVAVIPMITSGGLVGQIDPTVLSRGVTVSAQSGGVVVRSTQPTGTGAFNLGPIGAGTYDIVITAPGSTTRVIAGVPVVTGQNVVLGTLQQAVTLPPSATGTVQGTVTPPAAEALVRAMQTVRTGTRVEVASTRADGATGGYGFTLPLADVQVANWGTGSLPLAFAAVPATGARYTIEASAEGYLPFPAVSAPLTVGATPVVQNFVLTPVAPTGTTTGTTSTTTP